MLIEMLAAAGAEAPKNAFGFMEALEQGGVIAYATVGILGIMSFGSFFILFTKLFEQQKVLSQGQKVRDTFWRAGSIKEGAAKLEKNTAYRQIVDDGIKAQEEHAKLTDPVEAHDWLHGSLGRSEAAINAKLAGGLPFLATVGATSPFIGLFGTVIGIYRALIKIGISGSASIDQVAGPVGEALIMTALGLGVAVPAVLAYNWLQARNKQIAAQLSAFSTDVLGYMASNGAVIPAAPGKPVPAGKPAAPVAAAPIKK
ncbi:MULTISPECIES: MotA/TolQ/ExbB proton channel family protein [Blastomonas]|jgi:biopolymer transport protein ExbB|uniref:Biopolymer transport protein ExbB n=1 Tax=Blastomonas fulva TaxID=1550728 RepID=A0ABN5B5T7_9SPHN|nr:MULTISPECIES: MotA/TolQ/ExbB proton channel family protein [Blastomonas]AOF99077.1 motA/TolQ/ExbB proton channel family protein [Blastomonas sp. RAC04]ASR52383.1 flagellar motor protein MotA [Blastomonas fulva]MCO5793735.1 MotA/TolQ/ExbB proton channel family protein [Blastomonas sp.]MDM7929502.1 MotA/TolQ/ExbB proton channel family protein [Blastomonas fulva]